MHRAGPYENLARQLAGTPFASIAYVEETVSTNADAADLLDDARYAGHTIVAEYQRRGAGRKGRIWVAPAGTALLCTTILPRTIATQNLWVIPFWAGLAVRMALSDFGIRATLQWPNDVLLNGRKIAGVLCQSSVTGLRAKVACGVGINVLRPGADVEIEPPPAFCDEIARVDRAALLQSLLRHYDRTLPMLDETRSVTAAWDAAAQLPGQPYRIEIDGEGLPFDATAQGLESGGGLRVVRSDRSSQIVSLADARVLRRPDH